MGDVKQSYTDGKKIHYIKSPIDWVPRETVYDDVNFSQVSSGGYLMRFDTSSAESWAIDKAFEITHGPIGRLSWRPISAAF